MSDSIPPEIEEHTSETMRNWTWDDVRAAIREKEYRARLDEFPWPIREIAHRNAAVHRVAVEYARGQICTREEALCQMIVALETNWTKVLEGDFAAHLMMAQEGAPTGRPLPTPASATQTKP